ncbi:MAG: hypothetical protein QXG44_04265 [Candidatus Jordarchaeaceae archaeon]
MILRHILAFIVCLATMFGIIYFVAMGHTLMNLYNAYSLWLLPWESGGQYTAFWSNVRFAVTDYLIRPYTLATTGPPAQTFVPIAALCLAGFISGLITKHPLKAIIIGIICSFIVVIGYFAWGVSGHLDWSSIFGIITGVSGWDYALLFGLPAGLGMIGGLITREW